MKHNSSISMLIKTLKQPAYTGENRCLPCTGVNIAIAILISGGISVVLVAAFGWGLGPAGMAGLAILAICFVPIYLRGYLVPGTPELTRTYFPASMLRYFDHHETGFIAWNDNGIDIEGTLRSADIIEECPDIDDLCLSDAFRNSWRDQIKSLRDTNPSHADLASFLTVDPERMYIDAHDEAVIVSQNDVAFAQWESRAAFIADMAAIALLEERIADWDDLGVSIQTNLLYGLRIFLDQCPACDGSVVGGTERVKSCCRSFDVIATHCDDCGARLFEAEAQS